MVSNQLQHEEVGQGALADARAGAGDDTRTGARVHALVRVTL